MPRLNSDFKQQIKELSKTELEEIVIKMAAKEKSVYDFVVVKYLEKTSGEQELFEQTKNSLNALFIKGYKGRSDEVRLAHMISACVKKVAEFSEVSSNKNLDAQLLMYVLKNSFYSENLGTCFTAYENKLASLIRKIITIITKKLHPDYLVEYQEDINNYLTILHKKSNSLDYIYELPKTI